MDRKNVCSGDWRADAGTTPIGLSEEDIVNAVRNVPGYLDVSTGDLIAVYRLARQFALLRVARDDAAQVKS